MAKESDHGNEARVEEEEKKNRKKPIISERLTKKGKKGSFYRKLNKLVNRK